MVVEHEFVTTLDAQAALVAASRFLNAGGFAGQNSAFAVGETQWTTLDMVRGKKTAKAKNVAELPQRIILNFDRGRITLAASIAASPTWGGSSNFTIGFGMDASNESPKKMKLHQQLLLAIANGVEMSVGQGMADAHARAPWQEIERQIMEAARKRKKRTYIVAGIIIAAFTTLITLVILAAR